MRDAADTPTALVAQHLPLVGHAVTDIASRIPRSVVRDDLVSAGVYGLFQAARTFDATRGTSFAAYAKPRIRGALLDELRGRDWATRSVRGLARKADRAVDHLTTQLQRTPTSSEIAAELGIDPAALAQLTADVDRATVVNYESIILGGNAEDVLPAAGADPEAQVLARERCSYLTDAVAQLPDRLRTVIEESFFDDRPSAAIAADLGLSESRVSQMRSEALALLRGGLHAHLDAPAEQPVPDQGRAAKRKAAYVAAIGAASDYRSRLDAGNADVAEQVALAGLAT